MTCLPFPLLCSALIRNLADDAMNTVQGFRRIDKAHTRLDAHRE